MCEALRTPSLLARCGPHLSACRRRGASLARCHGSLRRRGASLTPSWTSLAGATQASRTTADLARRHARHRKQRGRDADEHGPAPTDHPGFASPGASPVKQRLVRLPVPSRNVYAVGSKTSVRRPFMQRWLRSAARWTRMLKFLNLNNY